ncbi:polyprenyl synthetase family protein [Paraburkholderia sp. MM6662-R1]|uniref:polyprenyl synthetase family protein n=1 Tax=Paraburkholderia sp. MM6662-R1 TaxID=2991066 RepID=UPI003D1A28CC
MEAAIQETLSFDVWKQNCIERLDTLLSASLTGVSTGSEALTEAMRYAVLDGGKRLRPLLCYAAAEAVGASPYDADGAACAVELVHAYSLVHDDLPSIDNDVLRRGKPTLHVKFGEPIALLAGDALQSLAFDVITSTHLSPDRAVAQIRVLSRAIGFKGMVAGQALDLANSVRSSTKESVETLHRYKTGALIQAALVCGGLCAKDAEASEIACLGLR